MKAILILNFLLIAFLLIHLPLFSQVPAPGPLNPPNNHFSPGFTGHARTGMIDWRSLRGDKNYSRGVLLYRAGQYAKAAAAYEKACDESYAAACTDLGFMYRFGQGVRRNYVCATKLYQQGCSGGNGLGCTNLGLLYWNNVLPKDDRRAEELFRVACVEGDNGACVAFSFRHENDGPTTEQALGPPGQRSGPERQDQIRLTLHQACRF